jgi:hypothetical protein
MIEKSDYVLVIASPSYRRPGDGYALPDDHRGVQAEAAALREKLHQDRATWLPRILPVLLPGYTEADIRAFLQPASASHYPVRTLTEAGARELLGILTGQPVHRAPRLGGVSTLPAYVPSASTLSCEPASGEGMPLRDPAGGPWQGGAEVLVNGDGYLIHEPVPAELLAADRSVVWREAVAERLAPQAGLVALRQVAELAGTRTAGQWRAAAEAEARLLADPEQVQGLPRLLDVEVAAATVTVVTAQPRAATWRAVYGPDGVPLTRSGPPGCCAGCGRCAPPWNACTSEAEPTGR